MFDGFVMNYKPFSRTKFESLLDNEFKGMVKIRIFATEVKSVDGHPRGRFFANRSPTCGRDDLYCVHDAPHPDNCASLHSTCSDEQC